MSIEFAADIAGIRMKNVDRILMCCPAGPYQGKQNKVKMGIIPTFNQSGAMEAEMVFQKIKTMSRKTLDPHHRLLLKELSAELRISQDTLLVLLVELENRGLVQLHRTGLVSVSLSNYGGTQEKTTGGLES